MRAPVGKATLADWVAVPLAGASVPAASPALAASAVLVPLSPHAARPRQAAPTAAVRTSLFMTSSETRWGRAEPERRPCRAKSETPDHQGSAGRLDRQLGRAAMPTMQAQ